MGKNIVLIGFMGCGKTTYAKKISKALNMDFVDTDRFIEENEGLSINEIFEIKGEKYFREEEQKAVDTLSKAENMVIATGGGIVKNEKNMMKLKETGVVIYIDAIAEHILSNLIDDNTRPLLQGENKLEKIKNLMAERRPFYEKYADIKIDVSFAGIRQNTERILKAMEEYYEDLHNTRT